MWTPGDPTLAEAGHRLLERLVVVVQEQAEHVHIAAAAVGAKLDAGDHLDAQAAPRLDGFGHAFGRVVISQGHPHEAALVREPDKLRRRQTAV